MSQNIYVIITIYFLSNAWSDSMEPYGGGDGRVRWVTPEWLMDNMDEVKIVDCQPNIHDYIFEHIPGAVYLNEGLFREPRGMAPAMYIPEGAVELIFHQAGIEDLPTVVYTGPGEVKGWGDGLEQTMLAYSLARFGHRNVLVLNGGLPEWKKAGGDVTKVFPEVEESDFSAETQKDFYIEYPEFKKIKDHDDVLVLDARPREVYEGQGPWIKPGHIPGAVNLPWASLMDDENKTLLKPEEEILELLEAAGASEDKTIICSCGTGREATNEFILFKWYLGYPDVRIYEGSFTEWTQIEDNPTVTGPDPY